MINLMEIKEVVPLKKYIKNLSELSCDDVNSYGAKAVKLSVLLKNDYCVSNGYAISCDMFQDFCADKDHLHNNIQSDNLAGELNQEMDELLSQLWMNISENTHAEPLIVRSSAIGEDSLEHSFAGVYESILNIRSFDDMKKAIKQCWASYYSDQAVKYRLYNETESIGMGVIVQKMIAGDKSGVIFTANPVTVNKSETVIEASYGLNIGVVDGAVSADRYYIDCNGRITSKTTALKKIRYSLGKKSSELQIENIESKVQQLPILSDEEVYKLSAIGRQIESIFGMPCDIEWTITEDEIYILQCRPIILQNTASTIGDIPFDCDISEETECSLLDRYSEPACVCYLSLLKSWQEVVYLSFYNKRAGSLCNEKPLLFYFNRVYWNQGYQRKFFDDIPFGKSSDKRFTKKVRLLFLMLTGSGSWYRRIDKYEKLLCSLDERNKKAHNLIDMWNILQAVIDVFCEYIGKDHYRFLGLAQIGYNLLSAKLSGMEKSKEVLAGLIESGASKNMTIESNHELFQLTQLAKSSPEVHIIFLTCPVEDIYGSISKPHNKEAESFKNEFDGFIKRHGHRGTSCDDLYSPHWVEKPEIVFEIIKQFLLNPSDNLKEFSRNAEDIGTHYNECKKTVFHHIDSSRKGVLNKAWQKIEIVFFSKIASRYMALRENQRYYFDKSWLLIRKLVLAIGKVFVERGVIRDAEDIFHLTIDEIALLAHDSEPQGQKDWQQIIDARIRTYKKNAKIAPPYLIKNDSIYRVQGKVDKKSFKAVGISSGTAAGKVRIISNVKDLSEVKDGEIAVVSTFHPSWTPILSIVSGLVMNYGNILSHGAVVAREYRIPVVIFNDTATSVFENGQWIEINGDTGRIRIISTDTTPADEHREYAKV